MKVCDDLRVAVLQAAIGGRLSNSNELDTPVQETLDLMQKNRSSLFEKREYKPNKPTNELNDIELFDIPTHWKWVSLNDIGTLTRGSGIQRGQVTIDGLPCVRYGQMYTTYKNKFYSAVSKTSKEIYDNSIKAKTNDILMALTGENEYDIALAVAYLGNEDIAIGGDMTKWSNHYMDPLYLVIVINSAYGISCKSRMAKGNIIVHISNDKLANIMLPIPPVEEQHRIVAKVDELMAKIDELEKIENQLESLKKDFPGDMKAALLQAAMQGKLTEQLEDDGDAVGLAEVIKAERNKLGKNKYIKGNIEDANIPDSWTAIKSGECFSLEKGTNVKEVSLPYLEAKYLRGKVSATMMTEGEFVRKGEKVILVDGENSGEVFIEPEDGIIGSTFKVLFIPESINEKYALYFLDMYRDQFRNNKKGAAIPHLNKDIFNNLLLPIPPLEEQQRIVEKLDQLLPLCDGLCEKNSKRRCINVKRNNHI